MTIYCHYCRRVKAKPQEPGTALVCMNPQCPFYLMDLDAQD